MIDKGLVVLVFMFVSTSCEVLLRHRNSRSHYEYNLDRLINRLDSHTTQTSREEVSAESKEPENSLWDDDLSFGVSSTRSSLDVEDSVKILNEKEKEREAREDAEDELLERNEEEDEEGFVDQEEQADSYRSGNLKSGETPTSWKWDNLGNKKSVNNLFHIYRFGGQKPDSKESNAQDEMLRHNKKMSRETLCRVPKPKVVKVSDVYPSTSKLYVPACTVLHQCGEDTGCCGAPSQRCGPKTTKRVELYFYTTYIVTAHGHQRPSGSLEKLPFYNHTECACQDRLEEVMPRDGQTTDYKAEANSEATCRCPSEYTVRRLANGSCTCDCFDKQRDCLKYKKGKEHFSHNDRLCIEMGTCQLPACDFGVYLRSSGRCPKEKKFRSWPRYH